MGRIAKGWQITKQSFHVIKADKEILIFPILSIIIAIAATILFLIWAVLAGMLTFAINKILFNITLYGLLALYFIFVYFISIFFQAAIISSATIRFNGKNPTFGNGIKGAGRKTGKLLLWAVISALVGLILAIPRILTRGKSRAAHLSGSIASSIFGTAWELITFYIVPVMLFENESVFGSIGRSKDLFKKTWGENVTAQFSTGAIFFLFSLLVVPLFIIAGLIKISSLTITIILAAVVYIAILMVTATSVNGILRAALYQYAIKKNMPQIYDEGAIRNIFLNQSRL